MDYLVEAKRVFDIEIDALSRMRDSLDSSFEQILKQVTECKGKVIVTGVGKSGHVGRKIASTLASLGTPSFFMHPDEALHGDLGMVSNADVVIVISYSGESDEILRMLPAIKHIGATIIAVTGRRESTLSKEADYIQLIPNLEEACYMGLAPTSSTTVQLVYGDSLAVTASAIYGFKDADFGRLHPAGALGKKTILRVKDLMATGEKNAVVSHHSALKDAILELSKKGLGIVTIVDDTGRMLGVITEGDLRRQLERGADIYSLSVDDVMSSSPAYIKKDKMAVEALNEMKKKNISSMPVVEMGLSIGTIRLQDIIGIGIV
ncbi:SIS domain-containing protein [Butyrivibrio sp. INlla16]|uniref:KpsF/GutQ family sugar-phosphate isomerase n=1 Tax=Butyrivibrio sp. INlla16 TaxID=1520807 RepID=UPI00088DEA71|nr:KpsF/GutQ family sugar-phosphate isomerase [Butyrivibrio sp. INlla16]SDB09781.1 arabinose-5-phosphate isomerase [Butyrivibrio sp. INlla16]